MTDRIKSYTVTLQDDIRSDDAEHIEHAISMIKGVISVDAHVTDHEHHSARMQLRYELQSRIFHAVRLIFEGKAIDAD